VRKAIIAAEAREAARKAKALLRERKGVLGGADSPASSAIVLRKTSTSASSTWSKASPPAEAPKRPPPRVSGDPPPAWQDINAYKSREDKVLANEEVRSMIPGCRHRHRRRAGPLQAPATAASSS